MLNLTAHRGKYNDEEQRMLIEKVVYSYNYGDVYTGIKMYFRVIFTVVSGITIVYLCFP